MLNSFSKVSALFSNPASNMWKFQILHTLPTLVTVCLADFSHSRRCKVLPNGFNFYFPLKYFILYGLLIRPNVLQDFYGSHEACYISSGITLIPTWGSRYYGFRKKLEHILWLTSVKETHLCICAFYGAMGIQKMKYLPCSWL